MEPIVAHYITEHAAETNWFKPESYQLSSTPPLQSRATRAAGWSCGIRGKKESAYASSMLRRDKHKEKSMKRRNEAACAQSPSRL